MIDISQLSKLEAQQPYLLTRCQGSVHVVLAASCAPSDMLKAFVHARILTLVHQGAQTCQVIDAVCMLKMILT